MQRRHIDVVLRRDDTIKLMVLGEREGVPRRPY